MLELDGQTLPLEEVERVARGEGGVALARGARARMEAHLDRGLALMRDALVGGAFSDVSAT